MLGDQIYEGKGKITGVRVLEIEGGPNGIKTETSYTLQSKLKGIDVTENGTFTAVMRSDNKQYGEDKAVLMAKDGSTATMPAWGIGQATGAEKISFRGFAIAGPSNTGKLAALNNVVIAFEAEIEGENLSVKGWEWK
jgi:hypothetical protein